VRWYPLPDVFPFGSNRKESGLVVAPLPAREEKALFVCKADGLVLAWNEAAERLLGFSGASGAENGLDQSLNLEESASDLLHALLTEELRAHRPLAVRAGKGAARSVFVSVMALKTVSDGGDQPAPFLCMAWDAEDSSAQAGTPDSLPVVAPPDVGPAGEASAAPQVGVGPLPRFVPPEAGGGVVLLVEDNSMVRRSISTTLRGMGFEVLAVDSGEKCLEAFNDLKVPLALLITDVVLPKMNGKELIERIRLLQPGLPVLLMSGYDRSTLASRKYPISTEHFLQKPFDSTDLAQAVRQALGVVV